MIFLSSFFYSKSKDKCKNLKRILENQELIISIWSGVSFYFEDPYFLSSLEKDSGIVYVRDLNGSLNINWESLGIPIEYATIEIIGNNINYGKIDASKVTNIKVGYGYKYHLVFDIDSKLKRTFSNVNVRCRI
jgi:hypothetical protein